MLSGLQGLKKFYLRGTFKGDEVRILTILYDQAVENTVEPVVIAMSSAFNAFPTGAQAAGPPPRKNVEYGTGIVVADDGASSPTGNSSTAASRSQFPAMAMPTVSPRTRSAISRCCASMARAG